RSRRDTGHSNLEDRPDPHAQAPGLRVRPRARPLLRRGAGHVALRQVTARTGRRAMTCSCWAGPHSTSERPVFGEAPARVTCRARPAAYAVARDRGGRVATVRARAADGTLRCWLPGGESQRGELPETTTAREVREELGRTVRLTGRIGEAVQFFYAHTERCWY